MRQTRERKGSIKQNLILLKFASAITKLNSIPRKTLLKQNHLSLNRLVVTEAGNMLLGCEAVRLFGCARRIKHGDCFCRDFINNSNSIRNYCRNYLCFLFGKSSLIMMMTKRQRCPQSALGTGDFPLSFKLRVAAHNLNCCLRVLDDSKSLSTIRNVSRLSCTALKKSFFMSVKNLSMFVQLLFIAFTAASVTIMATQLHTQTGTR